MILEQIAEVPLPAHDKPGGFDHAAVHGPRGQLYVAHTANDAVDVIDDLRQMGEQFGDFRPTLSLFAKLELRTEQLGARIDEGGPVALDQVGRGQRPVEFGQLGLVVEKFEMARRPCHKEENDALGLRGKLRVFGRERISRLGAGGRSKPRLGEKLAERHRTQAYATLLKKPASRDLFRVSVSIEMILAIHRTSPSTLLLGYRFVQVQQDSRDGCPRGQLRGRNPFG